MTTLRIEGYSGEVPRVSERLRTDQQARVARNVQLQSGEIHPLRAPLATTAGITIIDAAQTIYPLKTSIATLWLSWATPVSVAESPVTDLDEGRIYYTGDGFPKKTWFDYANTAPDDAPGTMWQDMAVPPFAIAPTLSATTGVVPAGTYVYVATLINHFGPVSGGVQEQSRPSPVSNPITLSVPGGAIVTQPAIPTTFNAHAITLNYTHWRVWRSTSAVDGEYQLVSGDLPIATTTFTDNVALPLPDVLPSLEWAEPPEDMQGLVLHPLGFTVGFRNNEVLFSEPDQPHAYPESYRLVTRSKIVALGIAGGTIVVLTEGMPEYITGSHPSVMSKTRIEISSACVSARSVVSDNYKVFYAEKKGLASIDEGGNHDLVTRFLYDPDGWQAINPPTLFSTVFMGGYVGFYLDTSQLPHRVRAFWLQTQDEPPLSELDIEAIAATPEFFVGTDDLLYEFNAHPINQLTSEWTSKTFILNKPENFGALQVDADFASLADDDAYNALIAAIIAANTALLTAYDCGEIDSDDINDVDVNGDAMQDIPSLAAARNITVTLVVDGVVRAVRSITSRIAVALPDDYLGTDIETTVNSSVKIYSHTLAGSKRELASVKS